MGMLNLGHAVVPIGGLLVGHQLFGLFDNTCSALLCASAVNAGVYMWSFRGNAKNILTLHPIAIVSLYLLAFLFGAPLFHKWERTLAWAAFTSSYSAIVLVGEGQVSWQTMKEVAFGKRYVQSEEAILLSWCVGLANWLGSVVIPLDWNRGWQKWPIPNSICGAVSLIAYLLLHHGIQWARKRELLVGNKDK